MYIYCRRVALSKYKICVYAICKNEEKFVDRWMDSVSEADMVVVLDTGSTDSTVEKLRGRGAVVYEEEINPWRFDTARNKAMDYVPEDFDICVSNDLDEVFESGWREKLESCWDSNYTRARYMFTWSYHDDGSPNKQFPMEKIHHRHGFKWVHPVHEVLEYTGEEKDSVVWIPNLVLNHYPDISKPRSQYLPLLELSVKENPDNDRAVFWLGREYMYYKMHDKSIETLIGYLKMPTATWNEERSAAMRFISNGYKAKGNYNEARVWLYRAIAECDNAREPYLYMAKLGYEISDWPLVYMMVIKGLSISEKTGSYLLEIESWSEKLYDLAAICTYNLGLYKQSLEYAKKANEIKPNDTRLKYNLELIENKYTESVR